LHEELVLEIPGKSGVKTTTRVVSGKRDDVAGAYTRVAE
jgi:hypothetical protein